MRWLLIMLVSSVALAGKPGRFDRFNLDNRRTTRGLEQSSLAAFEFAPLSGAGMGSSCPLPNWVLQSDALDSANWQGAAVSAAAPTVTANFAAGPFGGTTAERIQVPATTGTQQSGRYQSGIAISGVQVTGSFYVMGNGTSGTVEVRIGTTPDTCSVCSFNASSWTRCSVTGTPTTATSLLLVGNDGQACGSGSRSAVDILVAAAMMNVGSTAAPYIATTTAAMGQSITGARGESLTFSRASNGTCTKGSPTSGIANGDLVVMPSNQPRVGNPDGLGLALLVESSRANLLLRWTEYANAAWADVGTPTLTGSQTDPFNTTTAVQFDDNDGAAFEGRSQAVTVSAGAAYTMSCLVKAGTLAKATISLDGTTASNSSLSTTTWDVLSVTDASSSGVSITAIAENGAAAADTGTVIWGGCQVEAGSYRTSFIPTTTVAVTRVGEVADVAITFGSGATGMSMATTHVAQNYLGATNPAAAFLATGAPGAGNPLGYISNELRSPGTTASTECTNPPCSGSTYNGVASIAATPNAVRLVSYHTGVLVNNCIQGNCSAGRADTYAAPSFTRIRLGEYAIGVQNIDGWVRQVCVDSDWTRCR